MSTGPAGPEVLADYLVDEDWRGWFSGPVYDNPEPFSWTIYAKGSWVAWMLRHVIGAHDRELD